jgi:hypothetical protein
LNTQIDTNQTPIKLARQELPAAADGTVPTVPAATPRSVTIARADPHDGRLPITVTVTPIADLDASGGLFVDFRKGSKQVETLPVAPAPSVLLDADLGPSPAPTRAAGDSAIAALAAAEAKGISAAAATPQDGKRKGKGRYSGKPALLSHQIGRGCKLTTGQAETFRAEVALPAEFASTDGWFVRGRFVAPGGRDLKSAWLRV